MVAPTGNVERQAPFRQPKGLTALIKQRVFFISLLMM